MDNLLFFSVGGLYFCVDAYLWAGILDMYLATSNGLWCCHFSGSIILLHAEQRHYGNAFSYLKIAVAIFTQSDNSWVNWLSLFCI